MSRAAGVKQTRQSRFADKAGGPPEAYRGGLYDPVDGILDDEREHYVPRSGPGSAGKRRAGHGKFNLRGVIEVLEEFGLDPVAEVAQALQERVPVMHNGQQAVDGKGKGLTKPALDLELRTRVLMGLTEYVHPKLKSVEMTVKKPELTDDQVEQRLAVLLLQAQQTEAKKA